MAPAVLSLGVPAVDVFQRSDPAIRARARLHALATAAIDVGDVRLTEDENWVVVSRLRLDRLLGSARGNHEYLQKGDF